MYCKGDNRLRVFVWMLYLCQFFMYLQSCGHKYPQCATTNTDVKFSRAGHAAMLFVDYNGTSLPWLLLHCLYVDDASTC